MKIAVHLLLCILVLGIVGASSCKRDKPKDPIYITYTLGEVKDYMYFKPGTWWVYEHDLTGEIDSQYVTGSAISRSITKGTEKWSEHITLDQETMNMRIRSSFKDGWGSTNYFDIQTNGQNVNAYPYPDLAYQFERVKRSNIAMNSSTTAFYYPYNLCPKKNCLYFFDTLIINYQLKGFTYDTVRVFDVTYGDAVMQTPFVPTQSTSAKCYYAKNAGIIRVFQKTYRVLDGASYIHNWNLIKKNIIQ